MITVTPETYIRAESDRSFHNILTGAGGVNRFFYIRKPTPLDEQTIIRMNRDTLYSGAVVDTAKGASIRLPQVDQRRFISAQVIDNDHYCPAVFYEPGQHPIESDTRYAMVVVRIQLFDPNDKAEVARVNALQDQLVIESGSAEPMPPMQWEPESLKALTQKYAEEAKSLTSFKGLMGRGRCYRATYAVPANKAFWSITVYGADGYMKMENNILNSSNAKLNADGTFTAVFGPEDLCGDVPNRLEVTPGWNFVMRIYRPGPSVLDGSYVLPAAQPVK